MYYLRSKLLFRRNRLSQHPKELVKILCFDSSFNDEKRFLSFYFPLIGEMPKDVIIKKVNLDDAFHMSIRNDVAFDVNGRRVILIEH